MVKGEVGQLGRSEQEWGHWIEREQHRWGRATCSIGQERWGSTIVEVKKWQFSHGGAFTKVKSQFWLIFKGSKLWMPLAQKPFELQVFFGCFPSGDK